MRVAKDRSSNVYYDFEIRTDKFLTKMADGYKSGKVLFGTNKVPSVGAKVRIFGYKYRDSNFSTVYYVEGWLRVRGSTTVEGWGRRPS